MRAYAVRHKPSGLFIPRLETGKRRGGSHLEPSDKREARLFFNIISARAFLSNWLQGKFVNTYTSDESEPYLKAIKQPHRKKEDMEIVAFELVELSSC
jgi:protein involved in temperature-dependent protein secretion